MAAFVDTNILIYAFASEADEADDKALAAKALVSELISDNVLVVSAQVLGEFVTNAIRKGNPPLTLVKVSSVIEELSAQAVVSIDAILVQSALERMQVSRIGYWDALIVEAAIRSGASVLYTEDLHSGTFYGSLEIRNPFLQ
jgi:predicted nucleic acid-binding protein